MDVVGEGIKSKRVSGKQPTGKIKLGSASFCILMKDLQRQTLSPFGMTCTSELFTISLGTCTVKVNRVNVDFNLISRFWKWHIVSFKQKCLFWVYPIYSHIACLWWMLVCGFSFVSVTNLVCFHSSLLSFDFYHLQKLRPLMTLIGAPWVCVCVFDRERGLRATSDVFLRARGLLWLKAAITIVWQVVCPHVCLMLDCRGNIFTWY